MLPRLLAILAATTTTAPSANGPDDSGVVIVLGATSTEGERYAVARLQSLLRLPVVSAADARGRRQISVGSDASLGLIPGLASELVSLGDEGFILQTTADAQSVAITGGVNAPRGCMYGAYRFMELVGFDFLSFNVTNVPASVANGSGPLWSGPLHRREVPVLEWRHNNNANLELQEHVNFSIAMGNNQNGGTQEYTTQDVHKPGGGVRWAPPGFTETSFDLVPPAQYFPTNPEWFAANCTVGAKGCHGGAGNQLCWGNRSLQAFLAQEAGFEKKARPRPRGYCVLCRVCCFVRLYASRRCHACSWHKRPARLCTRAHARTRTPYF